MKNLQEEAKKTYQAIDKLYQELMSECNSADRNDDKVEKIQNELQVLSDKLEMLELKMGK